MYVEHKQDYSAGLHAISHKHIFLCLSSLNVHKNGCFDAAITNRVCYRGWTDAVPYTTEDHTQFKQNTS